MSGPFVIKPIDGWQAGDRAYCVHGSRRTVPSLEAGRVYRVASVTHVPGHVDCGLEIEGITLPDPMRGMWSNRFVKLRPRKSALKEIADLALPTWIDAYRASTGQAPHPHGRLNEAAA